MGNLHIGRYIFFGSVYRKVYTSVRIYHRILEEKKY